jgi:hypothetical protein
VPRGVEAVILRGACGAAWRGGSHPEGSLRPEGSHSGAEILRLAGSAQNDSPTKILRLAGSPEDERRTIRLTREVRRLLQGGPILGAAVLAVVARALQEGMGIGDGGR